MGAPSGRPILLPADHDAATQFRSCRDVWKWNRPRRAGPMPSEDSALGMVEAAQLKLLFVRTRHEQLPCFCASEVRCAFDGALDCRRCRRGGRPSLQPRHQRAVSLITAGSVSSGTLLCRDHRRGTRWSAELVRQRACVPAAALTTAGSDRDGARCARQRMPATSAPRFPFTVHRIHSCSEGSARH
jgi:hypothetical protein